MAAKYYRDWTLTRFTAINDKGYYLQLIINKSSISISKGRSSLMMLMAEGGTPISENEFFKNCRLVLVDLHDNLESFSNQ